MVDINYRTVHLVCKQMRNDPTQLEFREAVRRRREIGLGWRYDGLKDWAIEAIFARLRELGIDAGPELFPAQARQAGRCRALRDRWQAQLSLREPGFWADFPFIAAEELWERLTPELLCPEIVSNRLEEAFRATRSPAAAPRPTPLQELEAALVLADYLLSCPAQERAARFDDVMECGLHDYGTWAFDIVLNHGKEHPDEVTRLADALAGCREMGNLQLHLALALAMAGRGEQAVQRVRQRLDASPGDFWVVVLAGDVYEELGDEEEARKLWVRALRTAPARQDWEVAAQRIQNLLLRTGRAEDWPGIEIEAPPPAPPRSPPSLPPLSRSEAAFSRPQPVPRLTMIPPPAPPPSELSKVGRSDPCPCGSGKKYKKCCLRG